MSTINIHGSYAFPLVCVRVQLFYRRNWQFLLTFKPANNVISVETCIVCWLVPLFVTVLKQWATGDAVMMKMMMKSAVLYCTETEEAGIQSDPLSEFSKVFTKLCRFPTTIQGSETKAKTT